MRKIFASLFHNYIIISVHVHIVSLFLKPCKLIFGDFEYLAWLESSFQALYNGTTYLVLKCI